MKPIVSGSIARQHGVSEVSSPAAYSTSALAGVSCWNCCCTSASAVICASWRNVPASRSCAGVARVASGRAASGRAT